MPSSTEQPPVWRIERHPDLPSTSDLVRARAAEGEPEGLVVVAARQTAGRGRHGRDWASPAGNLYLTLLLRPAVAPRDAGGLALLAGLALAEACISLGALPGQFRLKWPNDLVHGDAKVAGILLEAEDGPGGGGAWVSMGIGVNVAHAPQVPGRRSAALADLLPDAQAGDLERWLLERIGWNYRAWQRRGMAAIVPIWSRHALDLDTPILVKPGRDRLHGSYAGIDLDGALLVELDIEPGRLRRVTTGEVLFAGEALAAGGGRA